MAEAVFGPDFGLGGFVVDPCVNGLHLPGQAATQLYRRRNGVKLLTCEMAVNGCDAFPKNDGQFLDVVERFVTMSTPCQL
ncbi:hypothetical protein DesfrDRAFT_0198 [Solidesulfovibrio fructosivorans JJ]]|uniref:Uncharacterized protein n=1 Tax=Solidesulfovibrio fructosivorans JJ] TaxID=596151 RepID=E1JRE9_SOLFR|nr:hypothetical protein [Solidesulfovibrio fructosivorans]EFL53150.1 hypothetical protein DesfrDRAFT_0198 [Solidesulfovibrio fructosivorans JJ]]